MRFWEWGRSFVLSLLISSLRPYVARWMGELPISSRRLWCRPCLPQKPTSIICGRFDESSPLRAIDARLVLLNQVARLNQKIRSTTFLKKGCGPRAADFRRKSGLDATNRPITLFKAVWWTKGITKTASRQISSSKPPPSPPECGDFRGLCGPRFSTGRFDRNLHAPDLFGWAACL